MAQDKPREWGETQHRFIWTGHIHHQSKLNQINKDYVGVEVESFRILPPGDAYSHQKGYRSISDMKCIILDAEHGEIARHSVKPSMLLRDE